MAKPEVDVIFGGSVPELYDALLVPMIFEPYARDLARRVAARHPKRVLELAAGTGAVTRALATALTTQTAIVATDHSEPMLQRASAVGTRQPVEWRQADALNLPFEDGSFDVVVCQFGVMFFPDKARGFAEARRVLAPGGMLVFNVWDRIEENEFAFVVTEVLDQLFAADPPTFVRRVPHGYHDRASIEADLRGGGFERRPAFETLTMRSQAASSRLAAIAYCQGTPLRNEIELRSPGGLANATDRCADEFGTRFGSGEFAGKTQAHIVTVEAP